MCTDWKKASRLNVLWKPIADELYLDFGKNSGPLEADIRQKVKDYICNVWQLMKPFQSFDFAKWTKEFRHTFKEIKENKVPTMALAKNMLHMEEYLKSELKLSDQDSELYKFTEVNPRADKAIALYQSQKGPNTNRKK